jgi:hypothetical protein
MNKSNPTSSSNQKKPANRTQSNEKRLVKTLEPQVVNRPSTTIATTTKRTTTKSSVHNTQLESVQTKPDSNNGSSSSSSNNNPTPAKDFVSKKVIPKTGKEDNHAKTMVESGKPESETENLVGQTKSEKIMLTLKDNNPKQDNDVQVPNQKTSLVVDTSMPTSGNSGGNAWSWGMIQSPTTHPKAMDSEEMKRVRHKKWLECAQQAIQEAKYDITQPTKETLQQVLLDDDDGECEDESTEDDSRSISSIELLIRCIGNCGDAEAGDPDPLPVAVSAPSQQIKLKQYKSAKAANSIIEQPRPRRVQQRGARRRRRQR